VSASLQRTHPQSREFSLKIKCLWVRGYCYAGSRVNYGTNDAAQQDIAKNCSARAGYEFTVSLYLVCAGACYDKFAA